MHEGKSSDGAGCVPTLSLPVCVLKFQSVGTHCKPSQTKPNRLGNDCSGAEDRSGSRIRVAYTYGTNETSNPLAKVVARRRRGAQTAWCIHRGFAGTRSAGGTESDVTGVAPEALGLFLSKSPAKACWAVSVSFAEHGEERRQFLLRSVTSLAMCMDWDWLREAMIPRVPLLMCARCRANGAQRIFQAVSVCVVGPAGALDRQPAYVVQL